MDLDHHQENSLFSFDGLVTEDILVRSDDEFSEISDYRPSTFKRAAKSQDSECFDFSPKFYRCGESEIEAEKSPALHKLLSATKTDTDVETEYSSNSPETRKVSSLKSRPLKKSTFTDIKRPQKQSEMEVIEDFLKQNSFSLCGTENSRTSDLTNPTKNDLGNTFSSEV